MNIRGASIHTARLVPAPCYENFAPIFENDRAGPVTVAAARRQCLQSCIIKSLHDWCDARIDTDSLGTIVAWVRKPDADL